MNNRTWLLAAPIALALALGACKPSKPDDRAAQGEPTAPSSEWVEPNPTEPAVPVELPKTPMTNVPASEAPPAAK